jgi:hypothetical protein
MGRPVTITLGALAQLARFHREGVEGAMDELAYLLEDADARAEICATLGTESVPSEPNAFVAFFNERVKLRRRDKRDIARTEAHDIGRELGMRARPTANGFDLDPRTFVRVVDAGGYEDLVFIRGGDDVRVIQRVRLTAILRELRTTTVERVSVDFARGLTIAYRGRISRGCMLLRLKAQSSGDSWIHVCLEEVLAPYLAVGT